MIATTKPGVLILSHQGFSFLEDLASLIRSAGCNVYILSSQVSAQNPARVAAVEALGDWTRFEATPSLVWQNVADALGTLTEQGRMVMATISVWDGYRSLMARGNQLLKVADLNAETVDLINDKLRMRQRLFPLGLTGGKVEVLTPEVLAKRQAGTRRSFVKPRRGLASFGAFELTSDLTWAEVEGLAKSISDDPEYRSVLGDTPSFIVEDYVEGIELSFEVIVAAGRAYVTAIHEKVGLEAHGRTTLETACVAPPPSLDPDALRAGVAYVGNVLAALGANAGCFHIEVRWDSEHSQFDVIEVNPRVGGAFINHSMKAMTGGTCLLELWLATLLVRNESDAARVQSLLVRTEMQGLSRPWVTTVFRVFYGEGGRQVASLCCRNIGAEPTATRLIAKAGDHLPHSEREIFLGQMLWTFGDAAHSATIAAFVERSRDALEVIYA